MITQYRRIMHLQSQVDAELREDPEYGWVSRLLRNGNAQELERDLRSLLESRGYSLLDTKVEPYGREFTYTGPLGAWVAATLPLEGKGCFRMQLGEEPSSHESVIGSVLFGGSVPDREVIASLLEKYR